MGYTHHLERQRNYARVPDVYREWGVPRNFASIDASQEPVAVVREALMAVNPYLQRVEGSIRTQDVREVELLGALNNYRSEGHLSHIERQWQRQEEFIKDK